MQKTRLVQAPLIALILAACNSADADAPPLRSLAEQDPTASAGEPTEAAEPGEQVTIRVSGIEGQVEIADDEAERSRGLMFREKLGENDGMLFIYPRERTLGFWMKNTLIPLDIAYADREGRIVDIQQMEPQTLETHDSAAPAQYALEMNQGWFEANGVGIGDRIEF
ncbi:MAG: DUF192 domain-containing protein [Gemmatimonadetes bacterium]|nr:DUF192 domain-containing protein [Gemmatimonadota bacterium]